MRFNLNPRDQTPLEELVQQPQPRLMIEFAPGSIIAQQYRIEEKLGGGGMGTVYRCTDLAVKRVVAIKFLHPHLVAQSKWLLRFQQEARAIAKLSHPNIISVLTFSINEEAPFIVMDYTQGISLADLLAKDGTLSIERTVKIMAQVAEGLAHAHEHGVVHRDLKPSNIILLDGTPDAIKILDFGIAKLVDDEGDKSAPKLTQTGEVFGSPAYMSPDQALGRKIDGRSDQYSFACVLFECLTGSPPFVGNTIVEVIVKHTNEVPPTLVEASLGKRFPTYLEQSVRKMLLKDPNERFTSMADAKAAILNAAPPVADEPRAQKREKGPLEKSLPVVALIGAVAVAICSCWASRFGDELSVAPAHVSPTATASSAASARLPVASNDNQTEKALTRQLTEWVARHPKADYLNVSESIAHDALDRYVTDSMLLSLAPLRHLRTLNLDDCAGITAAGMDNLVGLNLPLERLSLKGTSLDNDGVAKLKGLNALSDLRLEWLTHLSESGLKPLLGLHLRNLSVSGCSQLQSSYLNTVAAMKGLHYLNVSQTSVNGVLNRITGLKLATLEANDCHLSDADVEQLSKIQTLKILSIYRSNITEASLHTLERLPNLINLSIPECAEIGNIHRPLHLKLIRLNASGTNLNDADAESLAKMSSLRFLSIARTKITERGFKALTKLNLVKLRVDEKNFALARKLFKPSSVEVEEKDRNILHDTYRQDEINDMHSIMQPMD